MGGTSSKQSEVPRWEILSFFFFPKAVMFNHTPVIFPLKHSNCAVEVAVVKVGGCDSPCSEQSPEQSYQH